MPTTYAHYRFGDECISVMPEHLQKIVSEHRELFDIGVHGPDIFFYDLIHHEFPAYGHKMHEEQARVFFENAVRVYQDHADKEEMMAYLLGFLSHFTFDSQSHGYVDRKAEVSGITHNKVESQYDGYLMRKEGRQVNLVDRAESLKPSRKSARIIALFFPFDEKTMYRICKDHKLVISTLNCVSDFKYRFMNFVLDRTNDRDLPVNPQEEAVCRDSNLRMEKLQKKALKLYPKLLDDLLQALEGKKKLPRYFAHNFGPWKDYQEIPVLSYEEELNYKV